MSDDGYTFAASGRGTGTVRHVLVYRYSEELSDWYLRGFSRSEDDSTVYGDSPEMLAMSGDGEIVLIGDGNYQTYGMVRQYKVLNGKLEPIGPAFYGDDSHNGLGYISMSSDGKIIANGSYNSHNVRVYQLNDVQQTITANTYKNLSLIHI